MNVTQYIASGFVHWKTVKPILVHENVANSADPRVADAHVMICSGMDDPSSHFVHAFSRSRGSVVFHFEMEKFARIYYDAMLIHVESLSQNGGKLDFSTFFKDAPPASALSVYRDRTESISPPYPFVARSLILWRSYLIATSGYLVNHVRDVERMADGSELAVFHVVDCPVERKPYVVALIGIDGSAKYCSFDDVELAVSLWEGNRYVARSDSSTGVR